MKNFRYFVLGTVCVVGLLAAAVPQDGTAPGASDKGKHDQRSGQGVPIVEQQLRILTGKLDLTSDQQVKMKPILQKLHEATEKIAQEKSLSHEGRMAKAAPEFYEADKQMREMLSDDQKKKLDQYEQSPHPEMHSNLDGPASPVVPPQD